MLPYAPGARVVIRDEEWLVRRVDPSSDGGHLLSCDGISELVRGRAAQFLTVLEDEIIVLDPAKTKLVSSIDKPFTNNIGLGMLRLNSLRDVHNYWQCLCL